ncbi:MAG: thioredoxin [Mycoplasmataceae bacterium]|nr:thioredoxin [Mycoplasmataceae bacterium]
MQISSISEFEEFINSDRLTVVDFFATWCGPCKMLGPVFQSVSDELNTKVNFIKIDIDQFNEIASKYQVASVPTIIYFKNGNVVDKTVGFMDSDTLKNKILSLK